jgi:hypothetical protein
MNKDARLSDDRTYRYALWRTWDKAQPSVMFIGLNPSTADEEQDDPTIRRCAGFARSWGYGGLIMANLFAYRATIPKEMREAHDPVGPENDWWLQSLSEEAAIVIGAWGNGGQFLDRGNIVIKTFRGMHCLKMTQLGQPAHPLYLKGNLRPTPML